MKVKPLTREQVESKSLYPRTYAVALLGLPLTNFAAHYGLERAVGDDEGLGPYEVSFGQVGELVFAADEHEYSPRPATTSISIGHEDISATEVSRLLGELVEGLGADSSLIVWQIADEVADSLTSRAY